MCRKNALLAMLVVSAFSMGQTCTPDTDSDGVADANDGCPNTPICAIVDARGCPSDSDDDGVYDGCDECLQTLPDTMVYSNGCDAEGPAGAVPARCIGPDPRAKEIEYSLVNLTDATSGTILIKGVVDNIGLADFASMAGSQAVQLWEDGNLVASEPFVNLAVDESITVEYQRSWSIDGAEFQPTRYQLIVTYDPDIYDDGILTNDDCRQGNNSLLRGTSGINSLFE